MPVEFENAHEGFLEVLTCKGVAERVDGTVEIAEPIGDVVEREEAAWSRNESDDEGEDVPGGPADDERAQDDRDRPQSLLGSVLALGRRTQTETPARVELRLDYRNPLLVFLFWSLRLTPAGVVGDRRWSWVVALSGIVFQVGWYDGDASAVLRSFQFHTLGMLFR